MNCKEWQESWPRAGETYAFTTCQPEPAPHLILSRLFDSSTILAHTVRNFETLRAGTVKTGTSVAPQCH